MFLPNRVRVLSLAVIASVLVMTGLASPAYAAVDSSVSWTTTPGVASSVNTVFVPGLTGSAADVQPLLPTLTQKGDVYSASYVGSRFRPEVVAKSVADEITSLVDTGTQTVVIIGSSMGGDVSADAIQRLGTSTRSHVKLILSCSPYGDALKEPFKTAAFLGVVQPVETGGPTLYTAQALAPLLSAKAPSRPSITPSALYDQTKYIYFYQLPGMINVDSIYFQATKDEVVAPAAYDRWKSKTSRSLPLRVINSTHVGYADNPELWNPAFADAYKTLGVG